MTVRHTIKWLLILVLLAAAGGGGYAFLLWNESNERIRQAILAKCAELVPDWEITLGRARFDWDRRVHLYEFTLKAKGQPQHITQIPEIIITIDRELFARKQEVDVQKIRLLGPAVDLIRDPAGNWNWQQLNPPPASNQSLPEVEVVQATVRIRLDQADGAPAAALGMQNADLKLIPSGKRRFLVKGLTQVSEAGKLTVDGSWDIDQRIGWFNGRMRDVSSRGELSGLVIGSSPELRLKLSRVQAAFDDYIRSLPGDAPEQRHDPFLFASSRKEFRTAAAGGQTIVEASPLPPSGIPQLGASGTLDVEFKIAHNEPGAEPVFDFRVDVRDGQIENDALPFPLRDVGGQIFWNNQQLLLREMTASNGVTRIALDGRFVRQGEVSPGRIDFTITDLIFDDRLRRRLPESARKIYDGVQPAGTADLTASLLFDGDRVWQPRDVLLTFRNCTGRHVKFPYPVENIKGTIRQQGDVFVADLTGEAGRHPATLTGRIRNPGPDAETHFEIHVDRLPVDETFVAACQPELQKTLTALNLDGEAAGDITIDRPLGPDQKTTVNVTAKLTDASLEFVHFPLRLSKLQGDIRYASEDHTWLFENLSAEHGNARLTAAASFVKREAPGLLDLTLTARGADIDRQLEQALPPTLQETWKQLSPSGQFDLVSRIVWVPGQPASVTLSEVKVTGGGMTLRSLPYPLEQVETSFTYADGRVEVAAFKAQHDRTEVRARGAVAWKPGGDWRVRMEELFVDDLTPDRRFREALPADLRTIVEELDPAGPISLSGFVELRGFGRPQLPVTAAWDVQTIHSGGKLTAGIDLDKVFGRLTSRGTWNGEKVDMGGEIDLDSVVVSGYQLTEVRGPYSVVGAQVIVGSQEVVFPDPVAPEERRRVPPEERVTARAIGGAFTCDAAVALDDVPTYRLKVTMSQGRLEEYARRYMSGARNLEGVMDGWVDLAGRGSSKDEMQGNGQLRINPAALYEIPVMLQIFNVLGPPDSTAFRYALLDFDIARSKFVFNTIDLVGDTFSLRGRGSAHFDGRLYLDFYSMLPRSRIPIPLVNAVLGEATKGWVRVSVRGTTGAPKATVVAVPQVDETLKLFLGAFGAGPPVNVPRLTIPTFAGPQRSGQRGPNRPQGAPARQPQRQ